MPLPASGALSLDDIGTEFSPLGAAQPHQLGEFYRGGLYVGNYTANQGVPTTGAIAIGNFYGASNRNAYTVVISTNQDRYNAYTSRTPTYIAGFSDITYQISSGVVVNSTSAPTAAFTVPSAFNAGDTITIVNAGTICGRGGTGGAGGASPSTTQTSGGTGASGGAGLRYERSIILNNSNGVLAGGGGGGGGGGGARTPSLFQPGSAYTSPVFYPSSHAGGGGGGGGRGGPAPGGLGGASNNATYVGQPGTAGSPTAAGGAGVGRSMPSPWGGGTAISGAGGAGGGFGSNGTNGQPAPSSPAGATSGGTRGSAGPSRQPAGVSFITYQGPLGSIFG